MTDHYVGPCVAAFTSAEMVTYVGELMSLHCARDWTRKNESEAWTVAS